MSRENSGVKNVLVTTMSISGKREERDYYIGGDELFCRGFTSMEPGSKYFLHKYPIDEIVAIGTDKTHNEGDKLEVTDLDAELERLEKECERLEELKRSKKPDDKGGEPTELSAFEFYKFNMIKYLLKKDSGSTMQPHAENADRAVKKALPIRFVSEQIEGSDIDNISGIVNTIYGAGEREIHLYIDVQGGNRTSAHVRNTALSILSNQYQNKIHIEEITAVNYNPNNPVRSEIVDETQRYRIIDLASGMNAFIQYGKADIIERYCRDMDIKADSDVGKLVGYMVDIDEAISLCDVTALERSIENMSKLLESTDSSRNADNDFVGNIFNILTDGIKNDYGKLLDEPEVDYVELISWCARKGFIQQALTLIEDKMPEVYFKEGVLSYKFVKESEKASFLKYLGQPYEPEQNKIFNSLKHKLVISGSIGKSEDITEEKINNLEKDLLTKQSDSEFAKDYCRFHRLEAGYEKNYPYTNKRDSVSILKCCNANNAQLYECKDRNGVPQAKAAIHFTMNPKLDNGVYRPILERLFFLHEALKKERNSCNHASQKGVRLPIKVVKRAIELYAKNAGEILLKCK